MNAISTPTGRAADNPIGDDLIVGARAIAIELQLFRGGDPDKPDERKVFRLFERNQAPIRKRPGFGLVASRAELRRFFFGSA